jgi:hypothetical protein
MVLACIRQSITPCTMPPKRDPVWEHFLVADGEDKSANPSPAHSANYYLL